MDAPHYDSLSSSVVPQVQNHSTETTSSSAGVQESREWDEDLVQKDRVDIPSCGYSPLRKPQLLYGPSGEKSFD